MQTSLPVNRIDAVDALRGFALAGIVFAHMIEQFLAAPRPAEGWLVEPNLADHLVNAFNGIFIMGKFFSIFAVLFGMSFAIMMGNAAAKGRSFSGRFVWRLAILLLFGFLHSLLYRGDILTVYVAVGFCLPLVLPPAGQGFVGHYHFAVPGSGPLSFLPGNRDGFNAGCPHDT